MITQQRLKELLHYDPSTGVWTWRVKRSCNAYKGRAEPGTVAGAVVGNGYRYVRAGGKPHKASRLAWFYMTGGWPKGNIDHIDGDKLNDAWANYRLCNQSQNGANSKRSKNNTSGYKGVSASPTRGKWVAQIMVGRKNIYLGTFNNPVRAHLAYIDAARTHFGQFARAA